MASATESAIEWFTWMNSISKQPSLKRSPGFFVNICVLYSRSNSSSFSSMMPAVRLVAYIGTSSSRMT